ncbi:hypothetical protein PSAC2689_240089 [Paraburkholderia sacchari]
MIFVSACATDLRMSARLSKKETPFWRCVAQLYGWNASVRNTNILNSSSKDDIISGMEIFYINMKLKSLPP